jgi:hypothetical protein
MKSKLLVESCLGFKTTEEIARLTERLLKTSPKATYKKKALPAEIQFEQGERASIDIITTDSVDHENEVVLPNGIDLECWRKNPIVLWAHDDTKPIGRSLWIKTSNNGLKSKTLYAQRPADFQGDFLPDMVWALVQQQILKGRSIGFVPLEINPPSMEQIALRPDWANANAIITRSMIFEYSVVSVPANEDALQQAVSKGLKDFSIKRLAALGIFLGKPAEKPFSKPTSPTSSMPTPKPIRKRIDEDGLALKLLERILIDPNEIALKVIDRLRNRGKV